MPSPNVAQQVDTSTRDPAITDGPLDDADELVALNGVVFVARACRDRAKLAQAFGQFVFRHRELLLFDDRGKQIGGVNPRGVFFRSSPMRNGGYWHQAAPPELLGGLDCPPPTRAAVKALHERLGG